MQERTNTMVPPATREGYAAGSVPTESDTTTDKVTVLGIDLDERGSHPKVQKAKGRVPLRKKAQPQAAKVEFSQPFTPVSSP